MKTNPLETILLVEADVLVRHPLAEYLRECGFHVSEAVNGAEARAALKNADLNITIVVADVHTTESGFALARWARESGHDVEVILAGSIEDAVDKAKDLCHEGPALAKPYDHHLVLDRIKQMLAARSRSSSGIS